MKKFASEISNEEAAALPAAHFDGRIVVVSDRRSMTQACNYLAQQSMVGFDTETRPSFTAGRMNRVALLQLSTRDRCYLIRLCKFRRLPEPVVALLENQQVQKIGAAVSGDITGLNRISPVKARGFIDLQNEVRRFGIENVSLRKMAGIVLGQKVSKAQRLSNWEAQTLTEQQQMYAATDAWVCLKIYDKLLEAAEVPEVKQRGPKSQKESE